MKTFVIALALAFAAAAPANVAYAESDSHKCDNIHDAKEKAHCLEEQAKDHK